MDIPAPAPVNDKLMRMLKGAKKVMNKVESGDYETGHVDTRALSEDTIGELIAEGPSAKKLEQRQSEIPEITPERIANSKLPDSIKKAMLENPIPQATMNHTFTLEDVTDFEKDEKPMSFSNVKMNASKKQPITENKQQSIVGISESQIRGIVKDEMIEFFTKYFVKSLSEDVQKKTIAQLVESGKIKVKR